MRVSSAAIFTLATLAGSNVTQQAMAAPPTKVPTPTQKTANLVVPVIEDSQVLVQAVSAPETVIAQQFSQNSAVVPRGVNNNSPVVLTSTQRTTSSPSPLSQLLTII